MKIFHLQFKGYWLEVNKEYIPEYSGIYLIYTCRYVPETNKVSLSEIVYIGKAKNLKNRIADHDEDEFKDFLKDGETLCYACAAMPQKDLAIVENALVFAEKPVGNKMLKDNYSYEDAKFVIEGMCAKLKYTSYTITTTNDEQNG